MWGWGVKEDGVRGGVRVCGGVLTGHVLLMRRSSPIRSCFTAEQQREYAGWGDGWMDRCDERMLSEKPFNLTPEVSGLSVIPPFAYKEFRKEGLSNNSRGRGREAVAKAASEHCMDGI